jgi:hypothetical protein
VTVHDVARRLPGIAALRARCRALAMLDAVLSPEWQYRWYSFDAHWAPGEEMASMRNGSGDAYSIVFGSAGVFIRGFDHESPMSPYALTPPRPWPGVIDDVPDVFAECVSEPAFSLPELGVLAATACLWRQVDDDRWHAGTIDFPRRERAGDPTAGSAGPDADGADWLFALLVEESPDAYRRFAEDYYEVEVDGHAVAQVYALRPLDDDVVTALNPDTSLGDLADDIAEIGYPAPGSTGLD